MDDETKQRNEIAIAELGVMFKRARPIRDIWARARGELGIGSLSNQELVKILLEVTDRMEVNVSSRGIHLYLDDRLPDTLHNIAKLHEIWLRGTVGLSAEVEQFKLEQKISLDGALLNCPSHLYPQIDIGTRLFALGREANAEELESPIPREIHARRAAERGFLIVARRDVEQRLAKGVEFEHIAEGIIIPSKGGAHWDIETPFTETVKIYMQMIREELAHASNQSANKKGLAIDAPAFEKRPVPRSDSPNGKNRKRIKC